MSHNQIRVKTVYGSEHDRMEVHVYGAPAFLDGSITTSGVVNAIKAIDGVATVTREDDTHLRIWVGDFVGTQELADEITQVAANRLYDSAEYPWVYQDSPEDQPGTELHDPYLGEVGRNLPSWVLD